jgi:hypothetical protein
MVALVGSRDAWTDQQNFNSGEWVEVVGKKGKNVRIYGLYA